MKLRKIATGIIGVLSIGVMFSSSISTAQAAEDDWYYPPLAKAEDMPKPVSQAPKAKKSVKKVSKKKHVKSHKKHTVKKNKRQRTNKIKNNTQSILKNNIIENKKIAVRLSFLFTFALSV